MNLEIFAIFIKNLKKILIHVVCFNNFTGTVADSKVLKKKRVFLIPALSTRGHQGNRTLFIFGLESCFLYYILTETIFIYFFTENTLTLLFHKYAL